MGFLRSKFSGGDRSLSIAGIAGRVYLYIMKTTTQINYKTVGSGKWSFKSIQRYCLKKGIPLKQAAWVEFSINYGFDYQHLNTLTGDVMSESNSDPLRRMLGL